MTFNPDFFVPNPSRMMEGFDIKTMLRRTPTKGAIGIEIECEGNKFPKGAGNGSAHALPAGWNYTHDGSLRGVDNAEYVLKKPVEFSEVPALIHSLYDCLANYGTVLDESNRTSVHVHLNVQDFHLPRLTSFLALYFSIEELLTEWCGDHRVGNLFCLRAKDAPGIVSKIKKFIVNDGKTELTEGLHYSGMNANALAKFGSLEIRSLRGVTHPELLLQWVSVLERLYTISDDYKDPRHVTEGFSGNDPLDYLKNILGDNYDVIRSGISMNDTEVRHSMYEGIRLAQDLCYCRNWEDYKPADPSTNPFGRNGKMDILQAMTAVQNAGMTTNYVSGLAQSAGMGFAEYVSQYVAPSWGTIGEPGQVFATPATEGGTEEDDYFEPEPDYDEDY